MIARFKQVGRQPNPDFECSIGNRVVFTGRSFSHSGNGCIVFNNTKYELEQSVHRETFGDKKASQVSDILSLGNRVGYIYPAVVPKKKTKR